MRGWLVLVCAAALAGCYDQPKPNCSFTCGEGGACPTDYQCGPEDLCHLVLPGGGLAECQFTLPDGAVDAPIDAPTPDGPVDAPAVDASLDAPIDAAVPDANLPDAPAIDAVIDAAPIDALAIDAAPIDAAGIDATVAVSLISCSGVTPDATITTTGSAYVPVSTTIVAGQVIKFDPAGAPHDMVSGLVGNADGTFATPTSQVACLQFHETGTYPFFCSVHGFAGDVTVN